MVAVHFALYILVSEQCTISLFAQNECTIIWRLHKCLLNHALNASIFTVYPVGGCSMCFVHIGILTLHNQTICLHNLIAQSWYMIALIFANHTKTTTTFMHAKNHFIAQSLTYDCAKWLHNHFIWLHKYLLDHLCNHE